MDPLNYDDDDFYTRNPYLWDRIVLAARLLTWVGALALLIVLAAMAVSAAYAQPLPAPTLVLPSAPIPPERQAKDAPMGVMFTGEVLPAAQVDVVAAQQQHGWKEQLLKNSLPRPCNDCVSIEYKITGMVNGVIAPQSPSIVPRYLSGWVHKDARFVVLKIDNSAQFNIVPTQMNPPIIQSWKWEIPPFYDDGKEHTVCTRVFKRHADYPRVTTLVDVGPLDNAKCPGGVAQFKFR